MKKRRLNVGLLLGLAAALVPPEVVPPGRSAMANTFAPLRRWRDDHRVERTKQHDQAAKRERRRQRQMFDDALWARQKRMWG